MAPCLEPGDYVAVSTQQDRDGRLYADLVTVRESVQERSGSGPQRGGSSRDRSGRLDRLEGTVEYIDSRRGQFEVRGRDNRTIIVSLQYNAPRTVSDRFDRLREGDTVRAWLRMRGDDRFEEYEVTLARVDRLDAEGRGMPEQHDHLCEPEHRK